MSSDSMKEIKALDWTSRKYRSAWYLTTLFTILLVVPAIVSLILTMVHPDKACEFIIMPIDWYGPIVTLIWGGYFGANVAEKHNAFNNKALTIAPSPKVCSPVNQDTARGGQPVGTDNP